MLDAPVEGAEPLLYDGKAERAGNSLFLPRGESVSFDSHFNLFPCSEYAEYCGLREVTLTLEAEGEFELTIYNKTRRGKVKTLSSHRASGNISVRTDFSALPKEGYLYFDIKAESDVIIKGGRYESDREGRKTSIGVVICTYRREEYVKRNIQTVIRGMEGKWKDRFRVFVIDNAGTLDLPPSDCYTVIRNRNLGGSGGFTRGITEVCKDKSLTHFLLMDDDIVFDFGTLKRTYNLVSLLSGKYENASVGGNMLTLEEPCMQHENGAFFKGGRVFSINSGVDLTKRENLILDERESKATYNAWWYMCMPVSTVEKHGLPFPFFVKGDDIEYGIRSAEGIALGSGISVWHQGFAVKNSPATAYYACRNSTAANAMLYKKGRFYLAALMLYRVTRELSLREYDTAEMMLRGYDDFCRGIEFYKGVDVEKLNAEVMSVKPKYYKKEELEDKYGPMPSREKPQKARFAVFNRILTFLENFLPSFLCRKKPVVIEAKSVVAKRTRFRRTVVVYDSEKEVGYVCEYDGKRRGKLRRRAEKMFFKLLFGYGKLHKEYKSGYKELCTEEEWNKRFFGKEEE